MFASKHAIWKVPLSKIQTRRDTWYSAVKWVPESDLRQLVLPGLSVADAEAENEGDTWINKAKGGSLSKTQKADTVWTRAMRRQFGSCMWIHGP